MIVGSRHGFAAVSAVAVVFVIIAAALGSVVLYRGVASSATPSITTVSSTRTVTSEYTSSVVSTISSASTIFSSTITVATSTVTSYPKVSAGLLVPPNSTTVDIARGASAQFCPLGCFSPENVTVVIGVNNTVVWVNQDLTYHSVTATSTTTGPNGETLRAFNSGWIAPGYMYYWTFMTPGTYNYVCTIHSFMQGTIIVKSG